MTKIAYLLLLALGWAPVSSMAGELVTRRHATLVHGKMNDGGNFKSFRASARSLP